MKASALEDKNFDSLLERFSKIRESRGFGKLNKQLRGDFEERINKLRERHKKMRETMQNRRQGIRDRIQQRRSVGR